MRIIAGEKRGKKLLTLEGEATRPTLDRVKEGMFSSIQFLLPGAQVLDLFAGSGQLGLEALSRGAKHCVFIDDNNQAVEIVKENAKNIGLFEKSKVANMDAFAYLKQCKETFDIVFLDPPFSASVFPAILQEVGNVIAANGVVICESDNKQMFPESIGALCLVKEYKYGTVKVYKYKLQHVGE